MVVVLDASLSLSIDTGNCVIRAPGIYSGVGEYSIDTSLAVHASWVGPVFISTYISTSSTLPGSQTVRGTRGTFQIDYRNAADLIAVVMGAQPAV